MTQAILCFDVENADAVARAAREAPAAVLLLDRPFAEFPAAQIINSLVDPTACGEIDRIAMERMSVAPQALLAAIPAANVSDVHALAALLGGFTTASLAFAQCLKAREAIHAVGATDVKVVGTPWALSTIGAGLDASGEFNLSKTFARRGDQRTPQERIRKWVTREPVLTAIASIILHRTKRGKAPDIGKTDILMEASSRHLPYLDAIQGEQAGASVLFFSERRKDHIEKIATRRPDFPVVLTDHSLLDLHMIAEWMKLRARWNSKRLFARGLAALENFRQVDTIDRILFALLLPGATWRLFQSLAIGRLLDKAHPRAMILQSDVSAGFERVAIAHARRRSIPAACLQHGSFTEPVNMDGAACDTYFVWGKAAKDFLLKYRPHAPRVEIVGQPDYALAAMSAKPLPERSGGRWRLLYATRANSPETASYYPTREADFFDTIEEAWPADESLELVIKPHPRANPLSWYERRALEFSERTGAPARVTMAPLTEEIPASHLVLTTGGTTVLEAVALQRTAIYLVPPGRGDTVGWTDFTCLRTLWPSDRAALKQLLAQRPLELLNFASTDTALERARFLRYFINNTNVMPPGELFKRALRPNASGTPKESSFLV